MSGLIPILTYLQLSYLLTQLIYARTKSPQKGLSLPQGMEHASSCRNLFLPYAC